MKLGPTVRLFRIAGIPIELHASWQVLGVGISVQGPALRALKSIGLLERCISAGFGYSQVVNCDQDGGVQGIVELPRLNGPQYPSCVGMMRPLLHEVVAGALAQAGVDVRFGLTITALAEAGEGVDVTFSDGSRAHYELVVGADGANSRVREWLFGADLRPQYTGQGPYKLAESDGEISGIAGTAVTVELKASKPLQSAVFALKNLEEAQLHGSPLLVSVAPHRRGAKPHHRSGAHRVPAGRLAAPAAALVQGARRPDRRRRAHGAAAARERRHDRHRGRNRAGRAAGARLAD